MYLRLRPLALPGHRPIQGPAPIGHKYVGIVEEVGRDVRTTSVAAARARIDGAITPSGYLQLDGVNRREVELDKS